MSSTYREILKRLRDVSQTCRALVQRPCSASDSTSQIEEPTQNLEFPPLDLTVPPDFTDFLNDLGLSAPYRHAHISRIQKAINDQKAVHEIQYAQLCHKFTQLRRPSTSSVSLADYFAGIKKSHENSFARQLHRIRETVVDVHDQVRANAQSPKKPVFNAEYTPVLEQYFEYNAYPSARDRELLARKSSMTARQIEVWFQNHRRRARQEGRSLKRISTDPLPANISLKTLKEQMPAFMIRKEERRSPSLEKDVPATPTEKLRSPTLTPITASVPEFSFNNVPSSPSTWPASYSPRDGATFFSTPHPFAFEEPVWRRKASSSSLPRSSQSLSIDDLCSDLRSKLHLGGAGLAHKQRDYKYFVRSVATRQRYAIASHPALPSTPASKPAIQTSIPSEPSIQFGSTSSLRSRRRHQPYNCSLRKHPNWSLDKPSKSPATPSRPIPSLHKLSSPIPRTPSLSSVSSSGSSYCSDPPTPRDSPSSSFIRSLPQVMEIQTLDGGTIYDPYAFDFSADTVTSSYPSSTERYTSYSKPLDSSSPSTPAPYSRYTAY